jgi:L-serine dehydratase
MESIREIFKIGYGPSSSHTMGPKKAAEKFLKNNPKSQSFQVELYGSLAATGKGHLTDQVIKQTFGADKVKILWYPDQVLPRHPNGMTFKGLNNSGKVTDTWQVYSVGGGSIKDESNWEDTQAEVYQSITMDDLLEWNHSTGKTLWEYVDEREDKQIWAYLRKVWLAMKGSIKNGLVNEGRLPGPLNLQRKAVSYQIKSRNARGILKTIGLLSSYALAVAEENAAGGQMVTAPTCGSAGVIPAVLFYLKNTYKFSTQRIIRSLATAGLIGNLIKANASISGAEVGCQGEIGAACSMAAAAATQLLGGTVQQIEYASEMGIEHHLGLTCDPVEGYVQIPCIERNTAGALKAMQCATYSLFSDGNHQISFDEVLQTMLETGADMATDYKETSKSGLAKNWRNS